MKKFKDIFNAKSKKASKEEINPDKELESGKKDYDSVENANKGVIENVEEEVIGKLEEEKKVEISLQEHQK